MPKLVTFIEKEYILSQLQRSKGPITVFGAGKNLEAVIDHFDKENLYLSVPKNAVQLFSQRERVSIFTSFQGQRLTFPGTVRPGQGGFFVVGLPDNLLKAPQRKAIRVPPPGSLTLSFRLQNEEVSLECPESSGYSDLEPPEQSIGFDASSMDRLLLSFRSMTSGVYSKSGIVMFGSKRQPTTIEESLISARGKCLLIPDTRGPLPAHDPYQGGRIITRAIAEDFESVSALANGSELERSRIEKAESGVLSEVYCPILYYQYVVGYVYLMNDSASNVRLDLRAVDFTWEFARILAYSLKVNNYYKAAGSTAVSHKPGVVDLSTGGCLIVIPKAGNTLAMPHGAILYIDILDRTSGSTIQVTGRMTRHYDDRDNDYHGVAFTDIDESTASALGSMLYAQCSATPIIDETAEVV